jgi:hypothetical protein
MAKETATVTEKVTEKETVTETEKVTAPAAPRVPEA